MPGTSGGRGELDATGRRAVFLLMPITTKEIILQNNLRLHSHLEELLRLMMYHPLRKVVSWIFLLYLAAIVSPRKELESGLTGLKPLVQLPGQGFKNGQRELRYYLLKLNSNNNLTTMSMHKFKRQLSAKANPSV